MKKILIVLLITAVILIFIASNNSNPRAIISALDKKGINKPGSLVYRVYFLGVLPVGEAVFPAEAIEEYFGQRVYHLNATASSTEFFSRFFKSLAVIDSYVDVKQLSPVAFKQKVTLSGKQPLDKEVVYDLKEEVMIIAGVKRKIPANTQDPLSAVFNIRRMDFDKIKDFDININTNQKNYALKGTAAPGEIFVNKNKYKIVLLKGNIARRDKNPYHKSKITMVLLRDWDNTPILIKVFASGVLINVKLVDIK